MAEQANSTADSQPRANGGGEGCAAARAERTLFLTVLAASLAILIVIAWPMLQGKLYTLDDLAWMHVPMRAFFAQCLARGDEPFWMPTIFCGLYLHGDGQVGMYHPLHQFLYGCLPFTLAFNIELFLSYPALLAGMYFFLRRWSIRRDAALLGGLVFAFSGFNLLHFMHMHCVSIIAHIPWLLLAIDVMVRGKGRRSALFGAVVITLLTASQTLLGHLQFVWFSSIAEGLYFLLLFRCWRGIKPIGLLGAAKVLAILVGAVQLLPNYDAFTNSDRNRPSYQADEMSLPAANLFQFVGPYTFRNRAVPSGSVVDITNYEDYQGFKTALDARGCIGNINEYGAYGGSLALVFVGYVVIRLRRLDDKRPLAVGALGLAVAALILALGEHGHVYPILSRLPFVGWFRAPCRYVLLVHLSMAVAAAVALDDICMVTENRRPRPGRRLHFLWILPLLSVLAACFALWPSTSPAALRESFSRYAASNPGLIVVGPLVVGAATILLLAALRGVRHALMILLLFGLIEHATYGLSRVKSSQTRTLKSLMEIQPAPPGPPGPRIVPLRWLDNGPTLVGQRLLEGYAGLMPARSLNYGNLSTFLVAGVGWYPSIVVSPAASIDELPPPEFWQKIPETMPKVRLVTAAMVSSSPSNDIENIDVAKTALTSEQIDLPDGKPGIAELLSDRPGRARARTDAHTRQMLVFSESYHSGWRATVDSRPVKIIRAYGDFMAVVVPEGTHEVEFVFRPWSLEIGSAVSLVGLALSALFFGAMWWFTRIRSSR